MIDIYRKTIKGKKLQELRELKKGSWINVSDATQEEIKMVADLADLDFADVDDVMDDYEVPRIEPHENTVVIFVRTPAAKNRLMETDVLMIVLTEKYLITLSTRKNQYVENILTNKGIPPTTQQSKFLSYLLLRITQGYTRKIRNISNEAMETKRNLKVIESDHIMSLTNSEGVLNQYLSALVPMKAVYETLLEGKVIPLYAEDNALFEDLLHSINQSVGMCSAQVKDISSQRNTYQIIFTNDLNKTMKFLTSFTVLLTVPTIVGSLYGMNVSLPMDDKSWAFWGIMGVIFILSILTVVWFRKKRWF